MRRVRRRAATAAAAALCAGALLAPTADARPLGAQGARNFVHAALAFEFEGAWTGSDSRSMTCRRMSTRAFRCGVSWYIGDAGYAGRVRARLVDGRRAVVGFVEVTDDYCRYVLRGSDCTRTQLVRWYG